MGLNLSQIINKFLPVKVLGSDNNFFSNVTATTTKQALPIPFDTKEITVINDGTDVLNFFFGVVTNTNFPLTDPAWQYTGTWTDSTVSGIPSKYTVTNGASAVLKPNQLGVNSITLGVVKGSASGIAKIEVSLDNGVTWVNPSSIVGLTRSDGLSGAAIDSYDLYTTVSVANANITYNFPYNPNKIYALRLTHSGTKNASSGGLNVFIAGSSTTSGGGSEYTLKPNESLNLGVKVSQINVYSPSSTSGRVIAI
jgi:hypothetical protein